MTSADHFEAGAALPVLRKQWSSHLMSLSKQNILDVSDMPQKQAAEELGICLSTLRKLCAEHVIERALFVAPFFKQPRSKFRLSGLQGITGREKRWPHRKLQAIALNLKRGVKIQVRFALLHADTYALVSPLVRFPYRQLRDSPCVLPTS